MSTPDIKNIIKQVEEMNLPLIPCSTKSGGVHLFLFTKEPVPAIKIQSKLEEIAAAMGRTGDEIFSKTSISGQTNYRKKDKLVIG